MSRTELDVWRSFLRAHAHLTRVLETELLAAQRLSLASYDVLVQLAEAPGRRLRMTELADAVLLSRSGVTRLVDRLERSGLVTRARVDSDGRGVVAVLTQLGFDRLRAATGTHLSGVARHFADPLADEDLAILARTCERLTDIAEQAGVDDGNPTDGNPASVHLAATNTGTRKSTPADSGGAAAALDADAGDPAFS